MKFGLVMTPGSAEPSFPDTFAFIVPPRADRKTSGLTPSAKVSVVGAIVMFDANTVDQRDGFAPPCPRLYVFVAPGRRFPKT